MRTLDVPTRTRTTPKVSVRHPEQQQLFDPDPLIDKVGAARCLGVEVVSYGVTEFRRRMQPTHK